MLKEDMRALFLLAVLAAMPLGAQDDNFFFTLLQTLFFSLSSCVIFVIHYNNV